jgi:hypothetical protein
MISSTTAASCTPSRIARALSRSAIERVSRRRRVTTALSGCPGGLGRRLIAVLAICSGVGGIFFATCRGSGSGGLRLGFGVGRLYSWRGGKSACFARSETRVPEMPRRSPMAATVHSVNHKARMTASRRACASLLAASPTRPATDRPFLPEGQWPDTAAIPLFVTVDARAAGCLLAEGRWTTSPFRSRTFVQREAPRGTNRVSAALCGGSR